jgi:tetratricopeptide (TPR) repeat protein
MARERRSLQDLIRSRQQSGFVGRQRQVVQYQENLGFPLDDERRQFLFNIHGDAGVGKTYLTKQLLQIAIDNGCLTAYIDETVDDATSAMAIMAEVFSRGGVRLAEFEKRAAAYRERRHELEADPQAPEGVAAFLTKTAVTIGLAAARDVPFAGSLLAPVDAAAAADQINRARTYLARKYRDHADVRLLLSPADELTPVFVSGLDRAAAGRPVALFIDAYERTGPLLDHWLRRLYSGQYGDLPETLITTISGQKPLDPNLWGDYLPVIADVPLKPFSDAEACQFLASKNIHDESMIQVILTLSGRLPMWLATLAESRPTDAADIGDPAGDAVERFLKWEDDPAKRSIAMTAALPRVLNQDTLATIAPSDKARELFGWLCGLPFVTRRAGSWAYHEVVRAAMLRLQLAQAPSEWRSNQVNLAQVNARWARDAAGGTDKAWTNPNWIDHIREEIYHLLCADPINNLPKALASAVEAAAHSTIRARQWAELIAHAGRDTDDPTLIHWGQRLLDGIHDSDLTQYFTYLINDANLGKNTLTIALEERGEVHQLVDRYDEALADYNRAIELDRESAAAGLNHSASTERLTQKRIAAVLAHHDYQAASAMAGDLAWIYMRSGQFDKALRMAERCIGYTRQTHWGPWTQLADEVQRLQILAFMGQAEQVLSDVERLRAQADALPGTGNQPETVEPWTVRERLLDAGRTAALQLKRWAKAVELNTAVADSERARAAAETEIARTRFNSCGPLLQLGQLDEALRLLRECRGIFDRAHDDRMLGNVFSMLAAAERSRGHGEVALGLARDALRYGYLADDVDSIPISHFNLGTYLREDAGDPRDALAHHLAAALIYAVTGGQYLEQSVRAAAADLQRFPDASGVPGDVAELCRRVGEVPGARLGKLLARLAPDPEALQRMLGELITQVGALAGTFTETPSIPSFSGPALVIRGETYRRMERYDEALADFDRAIELDPGNAEAFGDRAVIYLMMERYDEALADFDRAIELDPSDAEVIGNRGETYRRMERYDEALADFDRAIELDPNYRPPQGLGPASG